MEVSLTRGERFKDARKVHNKNGDQTMDAVAKASGVSKGIVQALEDDEKDRNVGFHEIAKLADYYGVSADWLMGLSRYRTPDNSAKVLIKQTGLSEEAVTNLLEVAKDPRALHAFNLILGVPDIERLRRFCLAAHSLLNYYEKKASIDSSSRPLMDVIPEEKREEFQAYIQQWGGELVDPNDAKKVFAQEIEDALGMLLHGAAYRFPPRSNDEKEIPSILF